MPADMRVEGATAGMTGRNRWLALVALSLAQLMDVLDNTIVNVALPSAQYDLGFSIDNRQWIVTGYALAFGSLLPLGGRLADLFGRKRMFLTGVIGFIVASAIGGAANGFGMLLGARIAQGAFAALLAPAALSLVSVIFADNVKDRGRAFGIFGAVSGVGGAMGLVLGGLLTEALSWRWCLYANLLFGIVAFAGAVTFVPLGAPQRRGRLDLPGAAASTFGFIGIVYGLGNAASNGWSGPSTFGPVIAGCLLLLAFGLIERRVESPLLPLRVVLDRFRGTAYLTIWITGMGMFAVFLFLTYYVQEVLKFSPVLTGVAFLPMIGAVVVSSVMSGAMVFPRTGPLLPVLTGCLVAAFGMAMFTRIGLTTAYATHVLPALLVTGVGFGMIFSSVQNAATSRVHPDDAGVASALVNSAQQIGGSIGVTVFNALAATAVTAYQTSHPGMMANASIVGDQIVFWATSGVFVFGAVVAGLLFRSSPIPARSNSGAVRSAAATERPK